MALEDDLRDIRTRISQATTRKARAQAEHDAATARLTEADRVLEKDFGVTSPEEAKAKLTELKATYDDAMTTAKAALAEAGA